MSNWLCRWFGIGCPSPSPVPPTPPPPASKAVAVVVFSNGQPVIGAKVRLDGDPNTFPLTNGDGYTIDKVCPASLTTSQLFVDATGFLPYSQHVDLIAGEQTLRPILTSASPRPQPIKQLPLPPFEASDSQGDVHTTPPTDLVIPVGPARDFFRGDIVGVMLKEAPPFVDGANTTPPEMVMSFLLPKYVQFGTKWVDAILTAHAERDYTHFHFDRFQADAAGLSDKQFVDLIKYVQTWGFFTSCWLTSSSDDRSRGWSSVGPRVTTFLDEMLARPDPQKFIALVGEELNNGCPPGPGGADDIINAVCVRCNPVDVPVWLHFTANYPAWPEQALVDQSGGNVDEACRRWWRRFPSMLKGLCWQGDQNHSAGLMGAKMWDARRIIGAADPSLLTVAFELLASNQFMGRASEEQGCLRGLEMLWCPNGTTGLPEVSGFGNGCRMPEGSAI